MDPKWLRVLTSYNRSLKSTADETFFRLLNKVWRPEIPNGLELLHCIESRNVAGMIEWAGTATAQQYSSAAQHFAAFQMAALVKKYPYPEDLYKVDRERVAWDRLLSTEAHGAEVNERFRSYATVSPHESDLACMRAFIRYVLGDEPCMERIYSKCNYGPGANVGVHGDATNFLRKILAEDWTVTADCINHAFRAMGRCVPLSELLFRRGGHYQRFYCVDGDVALQEFRRRLKLVAHNKITFVYKDATTDRLIGIEPLLNGYVQKGIDLEMRDLLSRVGFDLHSQTRNSQYARFGSEDDWRADGFVTLDLKDASNSVFLEPVRTLLPPAWTDLLMETRSPAGNSKFGSLNYEFIASMGNGFCFPLETLLIAAACHAAGCGSPRKDYVVYGDDIVVRKNYVPRVIELLSLLGFQLNQRKSFTKGPFRESCGADWYLGRDVRPHTLDTSFDNLEAVFKFLNQVQRNDFTRVFFEGVDFKFFHTPAPLQLVRPYPGPDDAAVTVPLDQFLTSRYARWSKDLQTWTWVELMHSAVPDRGSRAMESRDIPLMYVALGGGKSHQPFAFRRKSKTKLRRVPQSPNAVKRRGPDTPSSNRHRG